MPRAFMTIVALSALTYAGCSDGKSAACSESSDCPAGNVCLTNRCERLCDTAETGCPNGFLCDLDAIEGAGAGICIDDSRVAPQISSVNGNGTAECVSATQANCMGSGFLVEGNFTTGTTFTLLGPGEGTSQTPIELELADLNSTGTLAELEVASAQRGGLAAGTYLLTAMNQAGQDEQQVQLLQGATGPDATGDELINRINSATGVINAARLEGGGGSGTGGSGGTLYVYDNSTTPATNATVGDRMWVRVTAGDTSGAPVSVAVDHSRFTNLCGDGDGCDVSLGAQRVMMDLGGGTLRAINSLRTGGTCKMYYDTADKSWTLANNCTMWLQSLRKDEGTGNFVDAGEFRTYSPSNAFGFDASSDGATDTLDGSALPIMSYLFGCYFAEAGPTTDGFQEDTDDGFHLILAGSAWADYPATRFPITDPNRACVLLIED
ncbi:MAG: hypothetical protein AAFQ82_07575 [Myxococcota bacterium]